jgi:hypothetical protein
MQLKSALLLISTVPRHLVSIILANRINSSYKKIEPPTREPPYPFAANLPRSRNKGVFLCNDPDFPYDFNVTELGQVAFSFCLSRFIGSLMVSPFQLVRNKDVKEACAHSVLFLYATNQDPAEAVHCRS